MRASARGRTGTHALGTRAIALPGRPDLLDYYEPAAGFLFEHGEDGIVGVGSAIDVVVPPGPDQVARAARDVAAALGRIDLGDGPGPVAVGALPFEGSQPATIVVPRIAIQRRAGKTWMIVTGTDEMADPETMPHVPPPEPWASLRVRPEPAPEEYVDAVTEARRRIAAHTGLRKVVLARTLVATSDHEFDVAALLDRLRATEPNGFTFGVPGLLGASPELLVSRAGRAVRANPLAGTAARAADPALDAQAAGVLLASEKDRAEHALVVDAVRDALADVCDPLDIDGEPSLVSTSAVWHLSTGVRGVARTDESALALAARLHPTPAVCGTPTGTARETIRELEGIDRGLYAGVVGWVDAGGDGEWAVALRCANVAGNTARLFAGAGVIEESDPEAELTETDAKFRAMLDALGYA